MNWLKKILSQNAEEQQPADVPPPQMHPVQEQPLQDPVAPQPQQPVAPPLEPQVAGRVVAGINWGKGRKPYLSLKVEGNLPPKSLEFFLQKGWRAFKGRDGKDSFTKLVTPRNLEQIKTEIKEFTETTSIPIDLSSPEIQKLFEQMPTNAAPEGSLNEAGKAELGEIREKINEQLKDLNERQVALLYSLIKNPDKVIDINTHMTRNQIAYQTARADLIRLVSKGVLARLVVKKKYIYIPNIPAIKKLLVQAA